jgi:hypothetical protein
MFDSTCQSDPYLLEWDPKEYLRQYYSTAYIPDDSQAAIRFLIEQLSNNVARYRRALDFGCGPTLYSAISMVPHVQELHLADYLPTNLREIRRWLNDEPDAHDWDVYFRGILELESANASTVEQIAARKAELRRKVTALFEGNIRRPHPLDQLRIYDLVVSFFCIEAVSVDRKEWELFLGYLSSMVAPGGTMVLAAVRRCNGYQVLGRKFPATCVDENDFARVLPHIGFSKSGMVIRAVPIAEWVEEGFDSICLVAATKDVNSD